MTDSNDPLVQLATSVGAHLVAMRTAYVHLVKTLEQKGVINAGEFATSLEHTAASMPPETLNPDDIMRSLYAIAAGIREAKSVTVDDRRQ